MKTYTVVEQTVMRKVYTVWGPDRYGDIVEIFDENFTNKKAAEDAVKNLNVEIFVAHLYAGDKDYDPSIEIKHEVEAYNPSNDYEEVYGS